MAENFRTFVIGASSGGYRALKKILCDIPTGLNAAFLVVLHSAFNSTNSYASILKKNVDLTVVDAENGMQIEVDTIYFAKPDHHLFISNNKILLSKGPRENLFRPSIDVLFRSAAVAYQNRCIGILLTGRLNDGTNGLDAIQKCGGLTVIENPETAEFSGMPLFAHKTIAIDYVVNPENMAEVIRKIVKEEFPEDKNVPINIVRENDIAMRIKSQISLQDKLGKKVAMSCATYGGPLWKMKNSNPVRYRCHVGHAFTQEALLKSQDASLEEALWVSIRTLEEKKTLLNNMIIEYENKGMKTLAESYNNKIEEVSEHINSIKSALQLND
ncbi:chemotaxis protein CheB [Lacinutrix neustonica]|uniref:protein-glutamate methylesterase n=1 Tax=Lacinutrix neustonica TaxID=2980107 RepID=A0A9E8MYB8_9FLAO|nr:chemotaxis protein CheB [Lacinutrix neustonica]WAC03145.1 chemotaxis protein CheB [Lacinutrix neustonica]